MKMTLRRKTITKAFGISDIQCRPLYLSDTQKKNLYYIRQFNWRGAEELDIIADHLLNDKTAGRGSTATHAQN